ncbi:MAG: TIGR04066 family peptide maturation system protein [Spirochaetales bacterium]|nr:TIGR04066 family peptide maturation system protein [Spirochaetales bacterium]
MISQIDKRIKPVKMAVYPFNRQAAPLVRHQSLIKDYQISSLASLPGWKFNGKDGSVADSGQEMGIPVTADFNTVLSESDTVFFTDYEQNLDFRKIILPGMIMAMEAEKDIVCGIPIEEDLLHELTGKCRQKGVSFTYRGSFPPFEFYPGIDLNHEKLLRINTPLVAVFGMSHSTSKFEIELSLLEELTKQGYKVAFIGTRPYSGLVGGISLPAFLFQAGMEEAKKILLFNLFIKTIEEQEKPDIILLGIPGGVMPFNDRITNKFGILAYEMCQAVEPDVSILSLLYEDYKKDYFDNLLPSMRYRLSADIHAFVVSNAKMDWIQSESQYKPVFFYPDSAFIDKQINSFRKWDLPLFNIFNQADRSGLCNLCIDKLAEYAEVMSV